MARPGKPWFRKSHGAWYATINGKQTRLHEDKKEAERIFHRLMLSQRPDSLVNARETVATLCDIYLDDAKERLKTTTFRRYLDHLQDWCDYAGTMVAEDLKPIALTSWLNKHPTWNGNTKSLATGIVKAWSRWCKRHGCLDVDPFADVRTPSIKRRKPPPRGSLEKLLGSIRSPEFRTFLELSILLGTRPGELRTLEASKVDLEAGVATVSGKTGERRVMLSEAARTILEPLMKRWPEGPVLRNTQGRAWTMKAINLQIRRNSARAGIDGVVSYHTRGAFATRAIKNGVPSLVVSKLLGHSDPTIVAKFYEQIDETDLKAAVEKASGGSVKE